MLSILTSIDHYQINISDSIITVNKQHNMLNLFFAKVILLYGNGYQP